MLDTETGEEPTVALLYGMPGPVHFMQNHALNLSMFTNQCKI